MAAKRIAMDLIKEIQRPKELGNSKSKVTKLLKKDRETIQKVMLKKYMKT